MEALTQAQLVELGKVVAEALGWTNLKPETSGRDGTVSDYYGDGPEGPRNCYIPRFAEDPAQIGPMLEHFRALWRTGPKEQSRFWVLADGGDSWTVRIEDAGFGMWGKGYALTLELAICLAIRDYVQQGALPPSQATTQNGEG